MVGFESTNVGKTIHKLLRWDDEFWRPRVTQILAVFWEGSPRLGGLLQDAALFESRWSSVQLPSTVVSQNSDTKVTYQIRFWRWEPRCRVARVVLSQTWKYKSGKNSIAQIRADHLLISPCKYSKSQVQNLNWKPNSLFSLPRGPMGVGLFISVFRLRIVRLAGASSPVFNKGDANPPLNQPFITERSWVAQRRPTVEVVQQFGQRKQPGLKLLPTTTTRLCCNIPSAYCIHGAWSPCAWRRWVGERVGGDFSQLENDLNSLSCDRVGHCVTRAKLAWRPMTLTWSEDVLGEGWLHLRLSLEQPRWNTVVLVLFLKINTTRLLWRSFCCRSNIIWL